MYITPSPTVRISTECRGALRGCPKPTNANAAGFLLHTRTKWDAMMLPMQLHARNRQIGRAPRNLSWKITAKIDRNLRLTLVTYRTLCIATYELPLLLLEALWICWTRLRRAGLYSAYSLNTAHPPEVAKTSIFGGLGRPIHRCPQPSWNCLRASHEFIHITKNIFWKFEEDRTRVAFRATVGRTWTFRWEKESLCTVVSHRHTRGASFY